MLTNDKNITTSQYWDTVYSGKRNDTKTDASNNVRPSNAFDRFKWVADLVEGPNVLGIASGHAHIEKRVKAEHPDWIVIASDQSDAARKAARFDRYRIIDAYNIPYDNKLFNTVICCQALEYMAYIPVFFKEAKRVSDKLIVTAPLGEMSKWSQLYVFDEHNLKSILMQFGTIEVEDIKDDIMLYKLKFHD